MGDAGAVLDALDMLTAAAWLAMALVGIALRIRRVWRLRDIVVTDPEDAAYLATVRRSTYLRLVTKAVLAMGAVLALSQIGTVATTAHPALFWAWRVGLLVALGCMIAETLSVDRVRDRLGRMPREDTP